MVIKILVTLFVAFAVSRVFFRYRGKSFGTFALFFWLAIWATIFFFVWLPRSSDAIAHILGLGRGVEALLAIAVVGLFYAVFRVYVKLEWIEHEITVLTRNLSMQKNRHK